MKKVYIETSIVSYLAARPSKNLVAAAWQQVTSNWWRKERRNYNLFTSELVISEASAGDEQRSRMRLTYMEGIPELAIDEETRDLANLFLEKAVLPSDAQADALHIAVASVHGMDYLLTWNCRHIDNAANKPRVRKICTEAGYRSPEICTPLELVQRRP